MASDLSALRLELVSSPSGRVESREGTGPFFFEYCTFLETLFPQAAKIDHDLDEVSIGADHMRAFPGALNVES
jgi:hypothetical protein